MRGRKALLPLTATALVALLVLSAGCSQQTASTGGGAANGTSGPGGTATVSSSGIDCDQILNNAVGMLQPNKLGVSTDRAQVADLLSQWMPECGGSETLPPAGEKARALLAALVSTGSMAAFEESRFDGRDAEHLRTCLLMRQIAEHIAARAENDRERVSLLFDFVTRSIALGADEADPVPLTPFEILLFGRGTSSDRAWVFAELLRQLRIDAVILRPKQAGEAEGSVSGEGAGGGGTEGDKPAPFLVGVLMDEPDRPVLLFDPRLGWAVPSPKPRTDSPLDQTAATLAELQSDPSLLQKMIVEEGSQHPLESADWKNLRVELVSQSDFSRPKMFALQRALPGEKSAIFFDPLDEVPDLVRGVVPRVAAFGGDRWTAEDVSLWPYPEQNVTGLERIKPEERLGQRLLARRRPFEAPWRPRVSGTMEKPDISFTPTKLLLRTRVGQLAGDEPEAIRSYNLVRLARDFEELVFVHENQQVDLRNRVPLEIARFQFQGAELASLWTGACQYDVDDFAAAAQTFTDFVRRFPEEEWADHARGLQARSYAQTEKYAAAIQALNDLSPVDPEREGHLLLQQRIRAKREQTGAE